MFALFGSALLSLFTLTSAYTAGQCTGDCQTLDPTVIQRASDGKYFRFATGNGISIKTATNLTGEWKYEGTVLHSVSKMSVLGANPGQQWVSIYDISNIWYLLLTVLGTGCPIH